MLSKEYYIKNKGMNFLFVSFMTVVGGLIVAGLIVRKERQYYLKQYAELERDYDLAINKATYYEKLNRSLEQQLAQKKSISTFNSEDKDTIVKALKKAMFYSHPDRNGGRDDGSFCKYNELYKKYK